MQKKDAMMEKEEITWIDERNPVGVVLVDCWVLCEGI